MDDAHCRDGGGRSRRSKRLATGREATRTRRSLWAGALITGLIAAGAVGNASAQDPANGDTGLGDLPLNPAWLANTLGNATNIGGVKNNVTEGAIANRNKAVAEWKAAQAAFKAGTAAQPSPLAKPAYNVVWASKQNVADVHADVISKFIQAATVNPQGLTDLLNPQFLPGLDGFQVIDMRAKNLDGSDNIDFGKVVNFVQLPLPWGIENEAHHMQYEWEDGDLILAGGLYTGTTHVLDPRTSRTSSCSTRSPTPRRPRARSPTPTRRAPAGATT